VVEDIPLFQNNLTIPVKIFYLFVSKKLNKFCDVIFFRFYPAFFMGG
jgi:hypothetical protein